MSDNPLAAGFYTVTEAARLIGVGNAQRIHGWLRGYPRRRPSPLIRRDFEPVDGKQELSFLDLMEVRFVEHFREHGVKASTLRRAATKLRVEFATVHPFALRNVLVLADKADVVVRETLLDSAVAENDARFRSLLTDNYVMYEAIRQSLVPGVSFDDETLLANGWVPRPDEFPSVRIDPKSACGRPITSHGVPTEALYDAWIAEKRDADAVAYWFNVSKPEVSEAIGFEASIRPPRREKAA